MGLSLIYFEDEDRVDQTGFDFVFGLSVVIPKGLVAALGGVDHQ